MKSRPSDWILATVVALLLCASWPSKSSVAELPSAGPVYVLEAFTTSCGVNRLFSMESRSLSSREMGPSISAWYLGNSYPRSRVGVNNFSADVMPTDGSCVTASVQSDVDGPYTVYMRPASVVRGDYALSVESASDIALTVFLVWALCWGVRQAARVGTVHHD